MGGRRVVVIGAGAIGLMVAYELARAGDRVTVLDRGGPGGEASGTNTGIVRLQVRGRPEVAGLARIALDEFRRFARDTGNACHYDVTGGYVAAWSAWQLEGLAALARRQAGYGIRWELLGPADLRRRAPVFGDAVVGATFCAEDGVVNPLRLCRFLMAAIQDGGSEVRAGCAVTGLDVVGGRITQIRTATGPVAADLVINCAGAWAGPVAAWAGMSLPIPIRPRKNQVLITARIPPCIPGSVLGADHLVMRFDPRFVPDEATPEGHRLLYLRQNREGGVMVGGMGEWTESRTVTGEGVHILARHLLRLFPRLAGVPLLRAWAGIMSYTPDDLPVIAWAPGLENFFLCAGHGGIGIALAPWTGRMVRALLTGGEPPIDPRLFRATRFGEVPLPARAPEA